MKELVFLKSNQALTTSLKVAEYFEKEHKHVIRDIETIIGQMASVRQSPKLGFAQMFAKKTYQA
ncbi:MAG: Rha family transcriptional regulator, partial [Selenomonadaceae bacterium]|nr:Rha family transcriptional regulator [Selenomonadaceae bacterium]